MLPAAGAGGQSLPVRRGSGVRPRMAASAPRVRRRLCLPRWGTARAWRGRAWRARYLRSGFPTPARPLGPARDRRPRRIPSCTLWRMRSRAEGWGRSSGPATVVIKGLRGKVVGAGAADRRASPGLRETARARKTSRFQAWGEKTQDGAIRTAFQDRVFSGRWQGVLGDQQRGRRSGIGRPMASPWRFWARRTHFWVFRGWWAGLSRRRWRPAKRPRPT